MAGGTPSWSEKRKMWILAVQRKGVRKYFYSSTPGRRGAREAMDKAEKWLGSSQRGADNPKVSDMIDEWLKDVEDTGSATALRLYRNYAKGYILPAVGKMRMDDLDNEQIFQRVINDASRAGTRGKPLSHKTLENMRGAISMFLKYCRKCGYDVVKPENLVIPKRARKGEKHILQPDDMRTLFASNKTGGRRPRMEWYINAFRFHVLTGLRPGELIGLQWGDIKEGIVTIRRSVNIQGDTTPGKNANARRNFMLTDRAAKVLDSQRALLVASHLSVEGDSPVFPDAYGSVTDHRTYERRLQAFCRHNGMTIVSPYELRHTWYSINKELPIELVKAVGGHSMSMDTFGVYGHQVDGDIERAAHLMDEVAGRILDPGQP